jgi:hypothetical protein
MCASLCHGLPGQSWSIRILGGPVQGDHQVQEADIPELSHDEFVSLLDSSDFAFYSASEGLEFEFTPRAMLAPSRWTTGCLGCTQAM